MPDCEDCVRGLLRGEVAVRRDELQGLRRVRVAHDKYLRSVTLMQTGAEHMRAEAARGDEYARGWMACLKLLALTIGGDRG